MALRIATDYYSRIAERRVTLNVRLDQAVDNWSSKVFKKAETGHFYCK